MRTYLQRQKNVIFCGRGGGRRGVGNQSGQRGEGGERYLCAPQATGSAAETREPLSFLFVPARQQQQNQKKGFFSRPPSDALTQSRSGVWRLRKVSLDSAAFRAQNRLHCLLLIILIWELAGKVRAAPDRWFHLLVRNFFFSALQACIFCVFLGILHPPFCL